MAKYGLQRIPANVHDRHKMDIDDSTTASLLRRIAVWIYVRDDVQ